MNTLTLFSIEMLIGVDLTNFMCEKLLFVHYWHVNYTQKNDSKMVEYIFILLSITKFCGGKITM